MLIVVDAQLSPHLAIWIKSEFNIEATSLRALNMVTAEDLDIFEWARGNKSAIIMTKDEDFVELLHRLGSPPKIIWITCGNTSNKRMKEILVSRLSQALELLKGSDIVEISD